MQTRKGQSIEDESMQIIENEIGSHPYNEREWPIVRRIIHSTADFDFARDNKIIFHKNAVQSGLNALANRCSIVIDVNGIVGLLNKQNPKDYSNNVVCNISEPSIMKAASEAGKTRAQMSMRMAEKEINGGIVVVGNAPTALLEVMDMFREGLVKPALVVGIPVGFVSAVESKDELSKMNMPFITNIGRKGGSPCASAIINALYKLLRQGSN